MRDRPICYQSAPVHEIDTSGRFCEHVAMWGTSDLIALS